MAEHRVRLLELLDAGVDLLHGLAGRVRQIAHARLVVRQELVQRGIERPDGDRAAGHRLEDPVEVLALQRQQLGQRRAAVGLVLGDDHLAHRADFILAEEHVLGAAQADALGAEGDRRRGLVGLVGVGAHAQLAGARRPSSSAWRRSGRPAPASGSRFFSMRTRMTSDGVVSTRPWITSPAKPSIEIQSPSLMVTSPLAVVTFMTRAW